MQIESSRSSDIGVLLIGHGTRDQNGLAEFAETVRLVASRMHPTPVEPAFLELATPTISAGFDRLVERGVRRIVAAPLLLFAAGHAKQDIPAAVRDAASPHEGVEWRQAEHLGCHPALVELSAQRFRAALDGASRQVNRCRLLVVGRGSHDLEATRETARYAELLGERVGILDVQVGFLAMAQPPLPDVLSEAARCESDTIVVQPHLLFHGELLSEVQQRVRDWSMRASAKQWLVSGHLCDSRMLGSTSQVVAAVMERCQQASAAFSSAVIR